MSPAADDYDAVEPRSIDSIHRANSSQSTKSFRPFLAEIDGTAIALVATSLSSVDKVDTRPELPLAKTAMVVAPPLNGRVGSSSRTPGPS
jgi:hypothetical protein